MKVDFSIVHMEIQKTRQFDNHGGDRAPMLTSFCDYQSGKNPDSDSDPNHWDIGLLVSGSENIDFLIKVQFLYINPLAKEKVCRIEPK